MLFRSATSSTCSIQENIVFYRDQHAEKHEELTEQFRLQKGKCNTITLATNFKLATEAITVIMVNANSTGTSILVYAVKIIRSLSDIS